ncbi:hypothetical protein KCP73_26485 [Salmonella enterica subsp. enterica]|nr:hypothetical protein KCP73_26485 [Salmonella enterica subsp. enterica]
MAAHFGNRPVTFLNYVERDGRGRNAPIYPGTMDRRSFFYPELFPIKARVRNGSTSSSGSADSFFFRVDDRVTILTLMASLFSSAAEE